LIGIVYRKRTFRIEQMKSILHVEGPKRGKTQGSVGSKGLASLVYGV